MVIDIICGVLALTGFYLGFMRGIIGTVFTVLSLILGLIAAVKFGPQMTEILRDLLNSDTPFMFIAGFIVTFVVIMLLIRMMARGLEGIMRTVNINVINQVFGGALMAGILMFVYSWIIVFADRSRTIDDATKEESVTYGYLIQFPYRAEIVTKELRPVFAEFWDYSLDFMDQLKDAGERTEDVNIYDEDEEEEKSVDRRRGW